MSSASGRPVRPPLAGGRAGRARSDAQAGALSLEAVLVLPVLALLTLGLLGTVTILRDVLLLHEAARVGARVAATTDDNAAVETAVRGAVPEVDDLRLSVSPPRRVSGDVVTVTVRVGRRLGPSVLRLRADAHARVEPSVDGAAGHPWWQQDPRRSPGPVRPWTNRPGPSPPGATSRPPPRDGW